ELFTALLDSQVHAAVMESVFAGWFVRRNAGFHVAAIGDRQRDFEIGAAVRKTDTELKNAVDRAIQELSSTDLSAITSRYGLDLAQAGPEAPPFTAELRSARSTCRRQRSQRLGIDAQGAPAAPILVGRKGLDA